MLKELLEGDARARKVFGMKELGIILKQLGGSALTQSERNRLSRDIKPKLEFVREVAKFENEFGLRKNQTNKRLFSTAVDTILRDKLNGEIKAILLFGSFADNTFTATSDIDICVVFNTDLSLRDATRFRMRVAGRLPDKMDIQVFSILPQKIRREIAANHKVLYKTSDYDNINFSIKYLKDETYFIRLREIFGVKT